MKKEYYDKQKSDYIHEKLRTSGIDSVWYPIISDIMLRRQFEYGLTDELLDRDIETFLDNVDRIGTKKLPEGRLGGFIRENKSIMINESLFLEENMDYEHIYETIAHEVTHAISFERLDNESEKSETKYDRTFPGEEKTGIMEVFTECRADTISNNSHPNQLINR